MRATPLEVMEYKWAKWHWAVLTTRIGFSRAAGL